METKTNLQRIRDLLNGGIRISSILVLRIVGITEVRHYLSILRKEGMIIKDCWIEKDGKRFKQWYLEFK